MNSDESDFISQYLEYTSKTECPTFFHRWTAVTSLSAYLGRSIFFNHGHFTLYPNTYTMLIGSPGTKKSSAIKIGAKLLKQAGYNTFAAKKTRQEKFLLDLAEQSDLLARIQAGETSNEGGADIMDMNLWGDDVESSDSYIHKPPAECFIAADEFNNFIGLNNVDFASILGELWDYEGVYDYKLKNSKSVFIPNPTISILGGNTPTGFSQAFSTDSIGQGFFSRLLLIYGEPSGVKFTFPPVPDAKKQLQLIDTLHRIKREVQGEVTMSSAATELLDLIYTEWKDIDDTRFEHYSNRRLTHLIKLALILTASRISTKIEVDDVVYANTLLTFTEQLMPKALGEFGRAKNSAAAHKVMAVIDATRLPITTQGIWKVVHQDFDTRQQLVEVLGNLQYGEKIQVSNVIKGEDAMGYLPIKKVIGEGIKGAINWNLLTDEESNMR